MSYYYCALEYYSALQLKLSLPLNQISYEFETVSFKNQPSDCFTTISFLVFYIKKKFLKNFTKGFEELI